MQFKEYQWHPGVYYYPGEEALPGVILSCGIHGNETGPIHTIEHLQLHLRQSQRPPHCPLLIIYGNTEAIASNKRFIRHNMNRLFNLPHDEAWASEPEYLRAKQLENSCRQFASYCLGGCLHLDLHSTIKPSRHGCFALQPVSCEHHSALWNPFIIDAHIQAWIKQTSVSNTFSQFSCEVLSIPSITLESGQVGGGNNPVLYQALLKLIFADETNNTSAAELTPNTLTPNIPHYRAAHDITRTEDFYFLIDEQLPNFSEISPGTPIFESQGQPHCFNQTLYPLFLNSNVPVGHRAGLLLIREQ